MCAAKRVSVRSARGAWLGLVIYIILGRKAGLLLSWPGRGQDEPSDASWHIFTDIYQHHYKGRSSKKSDDVRTTVSVKTLTVSSVEELNTRSMSLSACPCDLLVTVGSHEQQSISRRAPPPGRHFWSRARMGLWSGVRARIDTVSTTVHRSLTAVVRGKIRSHS